MYLSTRISCERNAEQRKPHRDYPRGWFEQYRPFRRERFGCRGRPTLIFENRHITMFDRRDPQHTQIMHELAKIHQETERW